MATEISVVQESRASWLPPIVRLIAVGLALLFLSSTASWLNIRSWHAGGVTILWPSNGFLIGVLLCASRRQWAAYLMVGLLVDFSINFTLDSAFWNAIYLACCNMIEVWVAAQLLYKVIGPKPDITERKQFLHFIFGGVIVAPAIASFLACLVFGRSGKHIMPWLHTFLWWFIADALGIAVITPLYLSLKDHTRVFARWMELAGIFLLLSGITAAVFWQTNVPLLFVLLACLLALGRGLGLAGSAFGLLIISIIGGFFTTVGRGPLALMRDSSLSMRELAFQSFILVAMLVLYILEVMVEERRQLEQQRIASEARFRQLTEVSRDMIAHIDLNGRLIYASPAVKEVLGWEPDEILGNDYWARIHPEEVGAVKKAFQEALDGGMPGIFQYRRQKKDQNYIWLEGNVRRSCDPDGGKPSGFVAIVRDITSRKVAEEELNRALRMVENLANHDSLTGIANRRHFDEVLEQEWSRAKRSGSLISLLLIDADHFKSYNDLYGHIDGDQCLRQIAETIQQILHRSADLLARYGGEEFTVILPGTDSFSAREVAEKIRSAVEACRIEHVGSPYKFMTLSIGCATCVPQQDANVLSLLQMADSALYQAKFNGRNRVQSGG